MSTYLFAFYSDSVTPTRVRHSSRSRSTSARPPFTTTRQQEACIAQITTGKEKRFTSAMLSPAARAVAQRILDRAAARILAERREEGRRAS
jgi:hypothetical protein